MGKIDFDPPLFIVKMAKKWDILTRLTTIRLDLSNLKRM